MNKMIIIVGLLLLFGTFFSQDQINELKKILNGKKGNEKAEILNKLSYEYCWNNLDSALIFANQALSLAEELNNEKEKCEAYCNIGLAKKRTGDFSEAAGNIRKAINIAEEIKDTALLIKNYSELANIISAEGKEQAASLKYYQKALKYAEAINDLQQTAVLFNNIAIVHDKMNNLEKALEYHQKSYDIKKKINNTRGMAFSLTNMGGIYRKMEKWDEALRVYNEAMPLAEPTGNKLLITVLHDNLGVLYNHLGEYQKALVHMTKSFEGFGEIGDNIGVAVASFNLADIYKNLGNLNKAFEYANKSLEVSKELESIEQLMDSYKILHQLYSQTGDFKSAYKYLGLYQIKYDSAFTKEQNRLIAEMETKYETEKKEQEIELQKATIAKQEITIYGTIAGLVLVLGFLTFVFIQYRNIQEANKELVRKNLEVINCEHKPVNTTEKTFKKKNELIENLKELIGTKKIYSIPKLTIDDVAKELNTNRTYLSEAINDFYSCNFNQFINELRIKEARILLATPENEILKIEAIAEMVGFSSKSVFNESFKKYTGISPSFFRTNALIQQRVKGA